MKLDEIVVKVDKPYPEIENAKDDAMTVAVLKNLTSSKRGELSGVLTYVFQAAVSHQVFEEFADIVEEIGIVEMLHIDLLMHAITEFGGVPKYEDYQGNPYSTNNLNYTTKLREMLENDIQAERYAIEQYEMAIKKVNNDSLKRLFERIIEDEKRHIEIFKTIRENVNFLSL